MQFQPDTRGKRLIQNTAIYFIGGISSKVLAFLVLPFVTHYIDPVAYGEADLVLTLVALILPLLVLHMTDAGYRYLMEEKDTHGRAIVITNTLTVVVTCQVVFAAAVTIFFLSTGSTDALYLFFIGMTEAFHMMVQRYTRGLGYTKAYAIGGVFSTCVTIGSYGVFIMGLYWQKEALLITPILMYGLSALYLATKIRLWRYIKPALIDLKRIREYLRMALPLVPSSILWWFTNTFGRIVIKMYIGEEGIGIYSVASKFPTVLTLLMSLFMLAWQESAISSYDMQDKHKFYTEVFNKLAHVIFAMMTLVLPITHLLMQWAISASYTNAWVYILPLYYGAIFNGFSEFFGTGFVCAKETRGALYSGLAASITSVALAFLLIRPLGIMGIAIASAVAFFVLWIVRIFLTRKYLSIGIDIKRLVIPILLNAAMGVTYYIDSSMVQLVAAALGFVYTIIALKQAGFDIKSFAGYLRHKLKANH